MQSKKQKAFLFHFLARTFYQVHFATFRIRSDPVILLFCMFFMWE